MNIINLPLLEMILPSHSHLRSRRRRVRSSRTSRPPCQAMRTSRWGAIFPRLGGVEPISLYNLYSYTIHYDTILYKLYIMADDCAHQISLRIFTRWYPFHHSTYGSTSSNVSVNFPSFFWGWPPEAVVFLPHPGLEEGGGSLGLHLWLPRILIVPRIPQHGREICEIVRVQKSTLGQHFSGSGDVSLIQSIRDHSRQWVQWQLFIWPKDLPSSCGWHFLNGGELQHNPSLNQPQSLWENGSATSGAREGFRKFLGLSGLTILWIEHLESAHHSLQTPFLRADCNEK